MKRRSFIKGLLGLAAVPIVAKAGFIEDAAPIHVDWAKPDSEQMVTARIDYDETGRVTGMRAEPMTANFTKSFDEEVKKAFKRAYAKYPAILS